VAIAQPIDPKYLVTDRKYWPAWRVAAELDVTVKVFNMRFKTLPDFPDPAASISKKTVLWRKQDVYDWIEAQA